MRPVSSYSLKNLFKRAVNLWRHLWAIPAFRFNLVTFVAVWWPLMVLYFQINAIVVACVGFSASDAALVLLPLWWIKRRRLLALVPVWFVTLFVLPNLLMYRWSGDLITFRSIYMTGNVGDAVTSNIPMLLRPVDFAILISAVAYTLWAIRFNRKIPVGRLSRRIMKWGIACTLAIGLLQQMGQQYRWTRIMQEWGVDVDYLSVVDRIEYKDFMRSHDLSFKGFPIYLVQNVIQLFESRSLSEDSRREIDGYLLSQPSLKTRHEEFASNRDKNLVVILVESLNSDAITATLGGRDVMPNLRRLINAPGTISNLNVVTQVKDGISSDGQLLLNTGILPLEQGSGTMEYGMETRFISLLHLMQPTENMVIFGDDGRGWGKYGTFKNFGFSNIVTSLDYSENKNACDYELLAEIPSRISQLQEPFLLEALTIGMHSPYKYTERDVPRWIMDNEADELQAKYYNVANEFDAALGTLIDNMKKSGIYDRSVILVVSDHSIDSGYDNQDQFLGEIPMTFVAMNTGVTLNMDFIAGQSDIFPTIAEIMGWNLSPIAGLIEIDGEPTAWRGVGRSMFDYTDGVATAGAVDSRGIVHGDIDAESAARLRKGWKISNDLFRGNYLKTVE